MVFEFEIVKYFSVVEFNSIQGCIVFHSMQYDYLKCIRSLPINEQHQSVREHK